jgi:hypothetical protein
MGVCVCGGIYRTFKRVRKKRKKNLTVKKKRKKNLRLRE